MPMKNSIGGNICIFPQYSWKYNDRSLTQRAHERQDHCEAGGGPRLPRQLGTGGWGRALNNGELIKLKRH
jgi:hypothetical protein